MKTLRPIATFVLLTIAACCLAALFLGFLSFLLALVLRHEPAAACAWEVSIPLSESSRGMESAMSGAVMPRMVADFWLHRTP
ncbi:MAG: hypothetical protein ACLQVN_09910 [Bryobacteraceae bacterium]